jgi:hypothetical protein
MSRFPSMGTCSASRAFDDWSSARRERFSPIATHAAANRSELSTARRRSAHSAALRVQG